MIKAIDIGIPNALGFSISGEITESDVSEALIKAKSLGEHFGNITIYEEVESFQGLEISALTKKFKYLLDVGVSNISAAAILTDKKWLQKIVRLEDKIFRNIDIRCFSLEQREEAIHFLEQYAPNGSD
ncbi:STAS/SEC14 domain-containing protein [Microbulbifer echini]|uniref:STAS/SEC14 domain-containing protein n=1 Tax=Microbulbifer echini TaxID=1529067 RepID=A0ABV4NN00_9GAMM